MWTQPSLDKFIESLSPEQQFFLGAFINAEVGACEVSYPVRDLNKKLIEKLKSRTDEDNIAIASKSNNMFNEICGIPHASTSWGWIATCALSSAQSGIIVLVDDPPD